MKRLTKLKGMALATFITYFLVLVWIISLKCNMETPIISSRDFLTSMNLLERAEWSFSTFRINGDDPNNFKEIFKDVLVNILLFLPVGMTLPFLFREKNSLAVIFLGFVLTLGFEFSQYYFALGGFTYIDLLTNTFGTIIGVLLLHLLRKIISDKVATIILAAFVVIFAAIAIFGTVNTINHIDLYRIH